jgi:hypothetical protein
LQQSQYLVVVAEPDRPAALAWRKKGRIARSVFNGRPAIFDRREGHTVK